MVNSLPYLKMHEIAYDKVLNFIGCKQNSVITSIFSMLLTTVPIVAMLSQSNQMMSLLWVEELIIIVFCVH